MFYKYFDETDGKVKLRLRYDLSMFGGSISDIKEAFGDSDAINFGMLKKVKIELGDVIDNVRTIVNNAVETIKDIQGKLPNYVFMPSDEAYHLLKSGDYVITNLHCAHAAIQLPENEDAELGDVYEVSGLNKGGWTIHQNNHQQIVGVNVETTIGHEGYVKSTNQYCTIKLLCVSKGDNLTVFKIINREGDIEYK